MADWQNLCEQIMRADAFAAKYPDSFVGPVEGLPLPEELAAFQVCSPIDAAELRKLLQDKQRRVVVKLLIFASRVVPDPIFSDVVRAGVATENPSLNRLFIEPCCITHGRRRVLVELLEICKHGSSSEKRGAVDASYWAAMPCEARRWPYDEMRSEGGGEDDVIDDLMENFSDWAVREFVSNSDLDLRRSLVSRITWAKARHPALVAEATAIARSHSDEYIRHRIRTDLGESRLFPCLPPPSGDRQAWGRRLGSWIALCWSRVFKAS